MLGALDGLTVDLVPHALSVGRDDWTGEDSARPLNPDGSCQAAALVTAVQGSIDAVYSSPATRCVQTVEPLARSLGLSIETVAGLATPGRAHQPRTWTEGFFSPMRQELGGAWMAGAALAELMAMGDTHPDGHVVACSHGDVIPVLVAHLLALYGRPEPPRIVDRGGWYRLRFGADALAIRCHGAVVPLPGR